MRDAFCLAVLGFVVCPWACQGQENSDVTLNTERPSISTGPEVTPKHVLVVENGVGITSGVGDTVLDGPETFLRLGIGHRMELRAGIPAIVHARSFRSLQCQDAVFGAKLLLPSPRGWAFATGTWLSVPIGSAGLTSGGWDPTALFALSHPINRRFFVVASGTSSRISNGTSKREKALQLAVDACWNASTTVTPFLEWAPLISSTQGNSGYAAQAGGTWLIRSGMQIDGHLGVIVRDAGIGTIAGVGYSFLRRKQ